MIIFLNIPKMNSQKEKILLKNSKRKKFTNLGQRTPNMSENRKDKTYKKVTRMNKRLKKKKILGNRNRRKAGIKRLKTRKILMISLTQNWMPRLKKTHH